MIHIIRPHGASPCHGMLPVFHPTIIPSTMSPYYKLLSFTFSTITPSAPHPSFLWEKEKKRRKNDVTDVSFMSMLLHLLLSFLIFFFSFPFESSLSLLLPLGKRINTTLKHLPLPFAVRVIHCYWFPAMCEALVYVHHKLWTWFYNERDKKRAKISLLIRVCVWFE